MKLPEWFPQVSRPWNPAYRETWDAMTPDEKRWSCLADMFMIGVVVVVLLICTGCSRADPADAPGDTSPATRATHEEYIYQQEQFFSNRAGMQVVIDNETGCQYLGYVGHGLTPRLVWDEAHKAMMPMGCHISETTQ